MTLLVPEPYISPDLKDCADQAEDTAPKTPKQIGPWYPEGRDLGKLNSEVTSAAHDRIPPMNLHINGEVQHQPPPCSVAQLVERLQLAGKRLAVERNGDIVPRSSYADTWLADGDRLEIVQAIGGG